MNEWQILVVDDEEIIREGCIRILGKDRIQVHAAADGAEGLAKAKVIPCEIALVDLKMPRMGGIEFIEEMQKLNPRTICIMITGYATIETAVEAIKKGAYDYIPKPFTPSQLRIVVQRAQERYRLQTEAEEARAQAEQAKEEAEKAKEQWINLVYHELKSPLGVVRSYLDNLLTLSLDSEKGHEVLGRCLTRTDALLQLVNDLLSLSRLTDPRPRAMIDLAEIVSHAVEFLGIEAQKQNISIEWVPTPLSIQADERMMEELVGNLLSNAIKYNRPGGTVTLTLAPEGKGVRLVVRDTGIGMGEEDQKHLFEQFFRVKSDATRLIAGTGLGLAIAKRIVDVHEGSIECESKPGVGTTFSIFLPGVS
ncbi:MAG: ATP-binding protein [Bacteroidota bacterium]